MRYLTVGISFLFVFFMALGQENVQNNTQKSSNPPKTEIEKEIRRLEQLREEIKKLIAKNQQILNQIKEERKKLQQEKKELEEFQKKLQSEKYKKLAKVFEKAVDEDPELAAERISKIKDPKEAAYILFNMKESKAGILMDYMDPTVADKIVRILTNLKSPKNSPLESQ
ncbi:hypothetical protein [Persephonella sp. KM09-Lau-8]|uniref:MotE family protein n=1 Tax=Persephonella sp. KM09-Lau-8 TaxID=1158345 RepID=UPI0004970753|nr:hypothetical protein [Persephonella sp. KM09-Lau-8]